MGDLATIATSTPTAVVTATITTATSTEQAATTTPTITEQSAEAPESADATPPPAGAQTIPQPTAIARYSTEALSFDTIATDAQATVVNIFCKQNVGSTSSVIGGSGVFIDGRGVILTNAHVAQYLLLGRYGISCTVRTGSPARNAYIARVLFIPTDWVTEHAGDIRQETPLGTGEDDYALLLVDAPTAPGGTLAEHFPASDFDAREDIVKADEQVLIAGYPAGFLGAIALTQNLWFASALAQVAHVYTFHDGTADVLSLGGTVLAQSGASGGAVFNAWGKLIALVSTSSQAETTGGRDLHAITMAHIDRSLFAHTNEHLYEFLDGDLAERTDTFAHETVPTLQEIYITALEK